MYCICVCPHRKQKGNGRSFWKICCHYIWIWKYSQAPDQEKEKDHYCKKCHVLTKLEWDRNLRNKAESLCICFYYHDDEEEEKKEAQAPAEDFNDPTGRNLASRNKKKCNLCWVDLFGCKQRKMRVRQKMPRKSRWKMIQFLLTSKHVRILNLMENPVKHSKEFWTPIKILWSCGEHYWVFLENGSWG